MLQSISGKVAGNKPRKPRKDFPLFPHRNGHWAKKVRGKHYYFGKLADDPQGVAALNLWLDQKDDLLAGRTPRVSGDELAVRDLCNRYLSVKRHQVETHEISSQYFNGLYRACQAMIDHFGKMRLVDDLASDDFESLRVSLAKTRAAWALGGVVQKIRSVFKYGYDAGLIDKPVRYGPNFKRPDKTAIRRERSDKPPRLFTAAELHKMLDAATGQHKAMILLGINCGLGNSDCGQLRFGNLDLLHGWLNYPRPKTGIDRRCPLWPETVKALQDAIDRRPQPKADLFNNFVFITKYGQPWATDKEANPVSHEFRKLLISLGFYRKGLSFYTLRHTFATEAGNTRDQIAVNTIMGHSDGSMAAVYRERIDDSRLQRVSNHVRRWLFPTKQQKAKAQGKPKPR